MWERSEGATKDLSGSKDGRPRLRIYGEPTHFQVTKINGHVQLLVARLGYIM